MLLIDLAKTGNLKSTVWPWVLKVSKLMRDNILFPHNGSFTTLGVLNAPEAGRRIIIDFEHVSLQGFYYGE